MEYDEQDAVNFILSKVGVEIDEDEILNVIDIIWDYYEDNGLLEIDVNPTDDSIGEAENLITHAIKLLKKDKSSILSEDVVSKIVLAELEYEKTLDIY